MAWSVVGVSMLFVSNTKNKFKETKSTGCIRYPNIVTYMAPIRPCSNPLRAPPRFATVPVVDRPDRLVNVYVSTDVW